MVSILVLFCIVAIVFGIAMYLRNQSDPIPSTPVPTTWQIPDQTGNSMSFSQFMSSMNTNGRYDRFDREWIDQHIPVKDDLVIVLTMDSAQALSVNKDERGRVEHVGWEVGWNQDAVSVRMCDDKVKKFPVSEMMPTPMNSRIWVVFQ
jgi:hypothetical protein